MKFLPLLLVLPFGLGMVFESERNKGVFEWPALVFLAWLIIGLILDVRRFTTDRKEFPIQPMGEGDLSP